MLDVTDAVRPAAINRLSVRVLNPKYEPIDGITLGVIPHRHKGIPYSSGAAVDHGGITDSVELMLTPAVRIADLYAWPDWKTGVIHVEATVRNAGPQPVRGSLALAVSPAASGETLATAAVGRDFPAGDTLLAADVKLTQWRLWQLSDPYLYRVTVRLGSSELSTRCGFRDFRFANGYFRLNGRRVFLKGSHTCNHFPVGLQVPDGPDWPGGILIYAKMAGFNCIRFIAGMPTPYQLDLCDELGLMVYEENYASWCLGDSPQMKERYDRTYTEMIRRDRNHPSIVIWGMLNETPDGPVFRHAIEATKLVRGLDETRLLILNSGRFDYQLTIGSICNPGSTQWECVLGVQGPGGTHSCRSPSAATSTVRGTFTATRRFRRVTRTSACCAPWGKARNMFFSPSTVSAARSIGPACSGSMNRSASRTSRTPNSTSGFATPSWPIGPATKWTTLGPISTSISTRASPRWPANAARG